VYCYASSYIPRFFECRPKKELISRLRREVGKLKGEAVSMANSSDPYPEAEAERCLTRRCLEILSKASCKLQIITKGTTVTRDIDLLSKTCSMVSITITTIDEALAKLTEPYSPSPAERLRAVETLISKGISASVRIDPIIPFVNDDSQALVKTLAEIGVKHVISSTYKIRHDNWQRFSAALPKTAERLRPLYFEKGEKLGSYVVLPKELRLKLMKAVRDAVTSFGMRFGTCREGLSYLNTATCDGSWLMQTSAKQ
jgi:DNA repair photolyase